MMEALESHPHYAEFLEYHQANPTTYSYFVKFAHRAKARGYTRISIQLALEIGRWETPHDFSVGSGFRDYFRALYSRLIMSQEPALEGMFEIRKFAHERTK